MVDDADESTQVTQVSTSLSHSQGLSWMCQLAPHGGGGMVPITDGKATSGEVTFAEAVAVPG